MSFVSVVQDSASEATRTLAGIGSELSAASTAAAAPTTGVAAAAQDEVSTAIAGLFGNFGREFQALSAEAQSFHDQFVAKLAGSMGQYGSAEAANVQQTLLDAVNAPANALLVPAQYSARVFDYPTPFGPIQLTLYGEPSFPGMVTVTGGTLQVPTPLALALDAVAPEANVLISLRNSSAAFTNAVQTGNPVAAAEALLGAPANAGSSFFFGQQTITESYPVPSGTQYTSADISIPLGGLLTPLQPVTLTLHSSNGTTTSIPLDGTEFGGLIPAVEGVLSGS